MRRIEYEQLRRTSLVAGLLLFAIAGCSSGTNPPPSVQRSTNGSYNYSLIVANIRPLDTTTGQYVLWLKMIDDTTWYSKPLTFWTVGKNNLDFQGTISLPRTPDSINIAYVSIEPMVLPSAPSSVLMAGTVSPVHDTAMSDLSTSAPGAVGNYSLAQASVIFTTRSSDTNRARQEFYLMHFLNGLAAPSALNMPVPLSGWVYGIWVLDSNFYPKHKFFYGWFRNADSASSKWVAGEYPFPGGFEPPPMNDPGARIEVTLEPQFAITNDKPAGPSPLTLLWAQLRTFIDFNDTLVLSNVWNSTAPEGKLTITN